MSVQSTVKVTSRVCSGLLLVVANDRGLVALISRNALASGCPPLTVG